MGVGGALPAVEKNANLLPPLCSPEQAGHVRVQIPLGLMEYSFRCGFRQRTRRVLKVSAERRNR